jgi:hypothetical protein
MSYPSTLTTQQQQDVLFYLGWPGKTNVVGSTHYNSVIASRLINLIPEIVGQVTNWLNRIQTIDGILANQSIYRASTLEIGDIKLNEAEMVVLRKERRRIIGELSDVLDIDVIKSSGGSMVSITV